MKAPVTNPGNPNSGHGHVYPRPDGAVARCGGPRLCHQCAEDQARQVQPVVSDDWPPIQPGSPVTEPCIAVPANFDGTEAEAVGLAVAGAVGAIQRERDLARAMLAEMVEKWPETSWAHDLDVKERAREVLDELGGAPGKTS